MNPNTPFTILFDFDRDWLGNDSQVQLFAYDRPITYHGQWINVSLDVPVVTSESTGNLSAVTENCTFFIKAFATREQSVYGTQHFLGISPGPATLAAYQFFYQFSAPSEGIRDYHFEVGIAAGFDKTFYNWDFNSSLHVNQLSDADLNLLTLNTNVQISQLLNEGGVHNTMSPE